MDGDGPGVDRARQGIAVAVDDIAALRDVGGQLLLATGMIPESGEVEDSKRDDGDDAGIDQHAEHQTLVHDGEQLAALADQSEPLGPWRDESGRRCVHLSAAISLEWPECFAASGASGSTFAIRTGLVTACAVTTGRLSTDFLAAACTGFGAGFLGWAAARPGFTTDLTCAGLADVAGLFSVDLAVVRGNATT